MYTKTFSASLDGIGAKLTEVEADVAKGLPAFHIVGLADKSINESKERVSIGMKASEFPLAPKRIIVNLAPANIKKEGPQFDLALAASFLVGFGYVEAEASFLEDFCFLGELSLTGNVKEIKGLLSMAIEAKAQKIKYLVVSPGNAMEANLVNLDGKNKIEVLKVASINELKELLEIISKSKEGIESFKCPIPNISSFNRIKNKSNDFSDVIGQMQAKRGLEIAAAGNHHILMIGPPGCGKSMIANRFSGLFPPLELNEALETTKIYSVRGLLRDPLVINKPIRTPHHSLSSVSLVGGGVPPKPGEISLAHNGILFLDELTEFDRFTIDQLRQILEMKEVTISKGNKSHLYPADFILIAACNPCPCGYLGDRVKECSCTPYQIQRYLSRLSGPFLDRVDLHIQLQRLNKDEMSQLGDSSTNKQLNSFNTEAMKKRILNAKAFQKSLKLKNLQISKEAKEFFDEAAINLELSARSHQKIIKIARTIADLDQSEIINLEHLAEALQFRAINWDQYMHQSTGTTGNSFKDLAIDYSK